MRRLSALTLALVGALTLALTLTQQTVNTQQAGTTDCRPAPPGIDKPVCVLHGRFTSGLFLSNNTYWVLRGAVFIGAPAQLSIQAGTTVIGETATRGTLVIESGAQIIAEGTQAQPIVMTSDQRPGNRFRGDWGGLVLNGRAPLNVQGGTGIGEGSTGLYGGGDPNESSGVLRFVRVEFAGIEFSPDNELNGIAFQAVGNGTIVDHVQVHFNKDDGVEMFGGTVNLKHLVLTAIGDDSIDWTSGWTGKLQFAVAQQRADDTDQGIEADNNSSEQDRDQPRSSPTIYNLTLAGDPNFTFGGQSTNCMRLRVGTAGIIRNFICTGFKDYGIEVRDNAALALIAAGRLSTAPGILFGNGIIRNGANWASSGSGAAVTTALRNRDGGLVAEVDPMLVAPFNQTAPDWRPLPGSPALTLPRATPPDDGFFEAVPYLGALGPAIEDDWTKGWTNFAPN